MKPFKYTNGLILKRKNKRAQQFISALPRQFWLGAVMCCFSCTSVKEKDSNDKMNGKPITVIEFDSCEYVGFFDGSGYHYTHKGNCKYCAERSLKVPF